MSRILKITAAGLMAAALTGATGCATNGDLDELRAEVQKTNATGKMAEMAA